MKKVLAILLSLTLLFSLTACSSSEKSGAAAEKNFANSAFGDNENGAGKDKITQIIVGGGSGDGKNNITHVIVGDGNGIISGGIGSDQQDAVVDVAGPDNTESSDSQNDNNNHAHQWEGPSCYSPKVCCICGATEGEALQHTGGQSTCIMLAACSRCGVLYGELAPHTFSEPTCYGPAYCSYCSVPNGSSVDHKAENTPTCTQRAKCVYCHNEFGDYADHNMANGICTVCGYSEIVNVTVTDFVPNAYPITVTGGRITGASYSVQGSDLYITIYGNRTGNTSGRVEVGWTVYGGGYNPVRKGNYSFSTSGNTFTETIVVSGVITSSYKTYKVWVGHPNLT